MDLVAVDPLFNLYDTDWPIRTNLKQQPPAKFVFDESGGRRGMAVDSIVSQGCIIAGGSVARSVLSPGVRVEAQAHVEESILMDDVTVGAGRARAAGHRGQGRRHSGRTPASGGTWRPTGKNSP